MNRPPHNFTRRLRPELERVAACMPALKRPAGVFVLPPSVSSFQGFMNRVHAKAGPRR